MSSEVEPSTMNSVTSPTTTTTTLPNSTAASTDHRPAGSGPGEKGGGNGGGKGSSPRGGRGSPRGSASPVGPGGATTPTGTGRRSPHGSQPSPSKDGLKSPTTGRTNGDSHSGEYRYYPSLLLPSTTTTIVGFTIWTHIGNGSTCRDATACYITHNYCLALPIPSTTTTDFLGSTHTDVKYVTRWQKLFLMLAVSQ